MGNAYAVVFRWSSQGDFLTADPHAQNEGLNNLINDHVYEHLTVRGKKLESVSPFMLYSMARRYDAFPGGRF